MLSAFASTTYDETIFGVSNSEVATKMPPRKTVGAQIFDWAKGPGSIILTLILAAFSVGGKLSDFRNEVAQMRSDRAIQDKAEEKRSERFENFVQQVIQSQNFKDQILFDFVKLFTLPYTEPQRKREAEKILSRIEQKRVSESNPSDLISPGGISR